MVAAVEVLEVPPMIVIPQKEAAMAVSVRIGVVTTLAAVAEATVAVTEAMVDQTAVTHHLIVVMALLPTVPGQEVMVVGPQQTGLTHQGPILEVSLMTGYNLT